MQIHKFFYSLSDFQDQQQQKVKIGIPQESQLQDVQYIPHQHPELLPGGAGRGPRRRQPWGRGSQRGRPPYRPQTPARCIGLIEKFDQNSLKILSPGFPRAANRGEIREHREAEPQNPVDSPQHIAGRHHRAGGNHLQGRLNNTAGKKRIKNNWRICAGHLPGGRPIEPSRLQQGEGREHGQDEEEAVPAEGGRHLGDQEGRQVPELEGGEVEERIVGDHGRHLHEQHTTANPQVAQTLMPFTAHDRVHKHVSDIYQIYQI